MGDHLFDLQPIVMNCFRSSLSRASFQVSKRYYQSSLQSSPSIFAPDCDLIFVTEPKRVSDVLSKTELDSFTTQNNSPIINTDMNQNMSWSNIAPNDYQSRVAL